MIEKISRAIIRDLTSENTISWIDLLALPTTALYLKFVLEPVDELIAFCNTLKDRFDENQTTMAN